MGKNLISSICYKIWGEISWLGKGIKLAEENIAIMMLHGVHDREMELRASPPSNSMALENFENGLDSLLRRYSVISLDQAVDMWEGRADWRAGCVVLTFDDSLACLLSTAARALAERELSGTFYLSTEVIDSGRTYWWKRLENAVVNAEAVIAEARMPSGTRIPVIPHLGLRGISELKTELKLLPSEIIEEIVDDVSVQLASRSPTGRDDPYSAILSWDGAREMAALGMTIGSHTVTHPNLSLLRNEDALAELSDSKRRIEGQLQKECRHVCYPYGAQTEETLNLAREAGYCSAVTTEAPGWNGKRPDLFGLRRFAMPVAPWRVNPLLAGVSSLRG